MALPLLLAAQTPSQPAAQSAIEAAAWTRFSGHFLRDADPAQTFHLAIAVRAATLANPRVPPIAAALDRLGVEALARQSYNAAFRALARALSVRRGLKLDEPLELAHSLDFALDRRIASPADILHPRIEPLFALDSRLSKPFRVRLWIADTAGKPVTPPLEETIDSFSPREFRFPLARLSPGAYQVHFALLEPGGKETLSSASRPLDIDPELPRRIRLFSQLTGRLAASGAAARSARHAAALETVQFYAWLYERALHSQVAGFHQRLHPFLATFTPLNGQLSSTDPIRPARDLPFAEKLASAIESASDPFAGLTGDLRLAYRSGVERPYQPYRLFIPPDPDPAKPLPLILVLHPDTGDEGTLFDCCASAGGHRLIQLAQSRRYMLAAPEGLGPYSFFAGTAADDAHEVLTRATTLFPAAGNAVFALGHSMGAIGALTLSLDKRFRFAAIAASGGYALVRTDISKAPDIPLLWRQSANDTLVSADESRRFGFLLDKYFKQFDYLEIDTPDRWSLFESTLAESFDFFDSVRSKSWKPSGRRVPLPSGR